MSDTKELLNILIKEFDSSEKEIQLHLTLNPDLDVVLKAMQKALNLGIEKSSNNWVKYNMNDENTWPPKYGKYFVHRKDGKIHWETWNGIGWAYNEEAITFWHDIIRPRMEEAIFNTCGLEHIVKRCNSCKINSDCLLYLKNK